MTRLYNAPIRVGFERLARRPLLPLHDTHETLAPYTTHLLRRRYRRPQLPPDLPPVPATLVWKDEGYHVERVLSYWRVQTVWWESETTRTYYRIVASLDWLPGSPAVFDIYHDDGSGTWHMERVHD